MKLYCDPASPSGRRILVTATEAGLGDRIEIVETPGTAQPTKAATRQFAGPKPVLERSDGSTVAGTAEICAHLDDLHERPKMMPNKGDARLDIQQAISEADDLIDATVSLADELRRSAPLRWDALADARLRRIGRILDTLERLTGNVLVGPVTLGHIAVGCALAELDTRLPSFDWRAERPALAEWHARFRDRPSMRTGEPAAARGTGREPRGTDGVSGTSRKHEGG